MSLTPHIHNHKVAVVTGGTRGIGYATVLQLAMTGIFRHVIMTSCWDMEVGMQQQAQTVQSALPSYQHHDTQISALPLVLGNPSSHARFVEELQELLYDDYMMNTGLFMDDDDDDDDEEDWIKVDFLVNNAAMAFKSDDPTTPFVEQTKPTLDVNFRGTVDFTEQMMPLLRNAAGRTSSSRRRHGQNNSHGAFDFGGRRRGRRIRGGHVVNVASSSAGRLDALDHGWPATNYAMSKVALMGATKIWAREEYPHHVRVNAVCPGQGTKTPEEGAAQVVFASLFLEEEVVRSEMEGPDDNEDNDDEPEDMVTGELIADFQIQEW